MMRQRCGVIFEMLPLLWGQICQNSRIQVKMKHTLQHFFTRGSWPWDLEVVVATMATANVDYYVSKVTKAQYTFTFQQLDSLHEVSFGLHCDQISTFGTGTWTVEYSLNLSHQGGSLFTMFSCSKKGQLSCCWREIQYSQLIHLILHEKQWTVGVSINPIYRMMSDISSNPQLIITNTFVCMCGMWEIWLRDSQLDYLEINTE